LKRQAAFSFAMAGGMIGIKINKLAHANLSLAIEKSMNILLGTLSRN
jgi:hypothetical protein